MENKLGIRHVLDAHGFDLSSNFKLVRHAPDELRYDRRELFNGPWFPLYQAVQTSRVYQNCDFIVVFTADGGTRAKFFAIYRVLKVRTLRMTFRKNARTKVSGALMITSMNCNRNLNMETLRVVLSLIGGKPCNSGYNHRTATTTNVS